jgi:hypothetical protein
VFDEQRYFAAGEQAVSSSWTASRSVC